VGWLEHQQEGRLGSCADEMAIEPGRVGGFAEESCVGILPVRHPIIGVVQGFVCCGDFVGGQDTGDDEMA